MMHPQNQSMDQSADQTSETGSPDNRAKNRKTAETGPVVKLLVKDGLIRKKQLVYALRVQSRLEEPAMLLDVLVELGYISRKQIRKIIRQYIGSIRIGDLLVELGQIQADQLRQALRLQAEEKSKRRLGEVLVAHNFIQENRLLETLSMQLGVALIEPQFTDIDTSLFSRQQIGQFRQHLFLPIQYQGDKVMVAFADPTDQTALRIAGSTFQSGIIAGIAGKDAILEVIEKLQAGQELGLAPGQESPSAVEIVDRILHDALEIGVSDVHMEPARDRLRIRFRQDGVLQHYKDFPHDWIPSITSRIKILCKADIAEKRRHQGGRIDYHHNAEDVDIRVSFYVTIHGEKIVLRLLRQQTQLFNIEEIGMPQRMLKRFREEALDCPSGVILITGPTGSGKTTTVYGCLSYLNTPETSIITAEEPVEYIIDGIAQCSIEPKINLTYEETLRHIVRQDPDVVVIGEIRDTFSAQVAVQTALTGHKVLSTFHTEDSIGGLVRLLNMEVDAFLISSTVVCVLAQRLLRKICPHCNTPYQPTSAELRSLGYTPKDVLSGDFQKGMGCRSCRYTGYKGRIAVFEMLVLNEAVRDAILERKTSYQIRNISIESTGLLTLLEDGIVKAAAGITSVSEVLRCLPRLQKPRPVSQLRQLMGL
ncbi:MAG: GspE/PulE family protein [Thermodesulfobacteriota bacterium]